jgi:hypothetical protein
VLFSKRGLCERDHIIFPLIMESKIVNINNDTHINKYEQLSSTYFKSLNTTIPRHSGMSSTYFKPLNTTIPRHSGTGLERHTCVLAKPVDEIQTRPYISMESRVIRDALHSSSSNGICDIYCFVTLIPVSTQLYLSKKVCH